MSKELNKTYDPKDIEDRLYKKWEDNGYFHAEVDRSKKPFTIVMPPPNITGQLHMGHALDNTMQDILIRYKRMQGYNVLHPLGYDSFGLPAEQYAVNTGHHPNGFTQKNIETFSKQLRELGFDYDWSKMISTSDPEFYKWTQWIFVKMFKAGLAYCKLVRGAWNSSLKR